MEDLEEEHDNEIHSSPHEHHGACCSHDHSDEIQVYQMPTLDKLAACDGFRREGLAYFEETQWLRARNNFQKILVYLDYTFTSTPEEESRALALKKAALLNSAICSLKMRELRQAISLSSQVIREWSDCAQAFYCKGKAYRLLCEFSEARETLKQGLRLAPKNQDILRELYFLDCDEEIYQYESKELAAEMFNFARDSNDAKGSSDETKPARPILRYQ
jgi:tetratricopeptide (TPR) repeat protein